MSSSVTEQILPSPDEVCVRFLPSGRRGLVTRGTTVLQAAAYLGVDIASICGGSGLCHRCEVVPVCPQDNVFDALSPPGPTERRAATQQGHFSSTRLACQAKVMADITIDVPPRSQVHQQLVRKQVRDADVAIHAGITLYVLQVAEPDMHEWRSDWLRVVDALGSRRDGTGQRGCDCDAGVMADLPDTLRAGRWQVTVAVREPADGEQTATVIAAWPGVEQVALGVAIDIGSTTIAAQLCDLQTGEVIDSAGVMNPQIRYGEDLMSRVAFAMMHPDRWREMTHAVRRAIADLVNDLLIRSGNTPDKVLSLSAVGNPVMHHLFLGINPQALGSAPFALAVETAQKRSAHELGLPACTGAQIYLLPCIAGHVGADAAGMILAERPDQQSAVTLLVDVGTNAEIVLGNRERLLACSSPTGPAFEGAQISCGQRAAPGAIERVSIDPDTLVPRYRVIGCPLWSDEPGFAGAIAGTGVTGICGSGLIDAIAQMRLTSLLREDGTIDGALAARCSHVQSDGRTYAFELAGKSTGCQQPVRITQNDVRAVQLAKAALYAGVELLRERLGNVAIEQVRLAGAFGSYIDVRSALILGLLPDCPEEHVSAVGNAAGTGARTALLDTRSRVLIERLVNRVEKIETAIESTFQDKFIAAMSIPHADHPFDTLRNRVQLPVSSGQGATGAASASRAGRRHRRRRHVVPVEPPPEH